MSGGDDNLRSPLLRCGWIHLDDRRRGHRPYQRENARLDPTDRLLHAPGPDRITLTPVPRPPAPRILTDAIPELTARILGTSAPDH
jgi:hypothetical protein